MHLVVGEVDRDGRDACVAAFRTVVPRHGAGVCHAVHSLVRSRLGLGSGRPRTNANGRVAGTAHSADRRAHRPVGTRRDRPPRWPGTPERRTPARVPAGAAFATTPALALAPALRDRARAAGVAHRAVPADPGDGDGPDCRTGLAARGEPDLVHVGQDVGAREPAAAAAAAAQPLPPTRRPGRKRTDGAAATGPQARAGRPRRRSP